MVLVSLSQNAGMMDVPLGNFYALSKEEAEKTLIEKGFKPADSDNDTWSRGEGRKLRLGYIGPEEATIEELEPISELE